MSTRPVVREHHGVVALGVVRAEEQRDFARRYKILQMIDCGMIGAELLEVSLVKLAPAVRSRPNQVLRHALGAMSFSHSSSLACSFVSLRACGRA